MYEFDEEFDEKFKILQKEYIIKLPEKIEQIEIAGSAVNELKNSDKALENLCKLVHKLSGSSAMYGFSLISQISNEFEVLLNQIIQNELCINEHNAIIFVYIERLKQAFKKGELSE